MRKDMGGYIKEMVGNLMIWIAAQLEGKLNRET